MAENVFLQRLCGATNSHDIDAVVAMFHDDYENTMPVHPSRGFRDRAGPPELDRDLRVRA